MKDDWKQTVVTTSKRDWTTSRSAPGRSTAQGKNAQPASTGTSTRKLLLGVALLVSVGGAGIVFVRSNQSRERKVRQIAEAIVLNHVKTPATASLATEIAYRSDTNNYFVAVVQTDAENGFGAMIRSYVALVVRSDTVQPPKHGIRTSQAVRDLCRVQEGTDLWVESAHTFDSRPDREVLRACRELTNLGWTAHKDDPGWAIE